MHFTRNISIFLLLPLTIVFSQINYEYETEWGGLGGGGGLFNRPLNVAVDGDDNIYVVDDLNARIHKFDSDGNFISMFGSKGYDEGQFDVPFGITYDVTGFIYVTDMWINRVSKFNTSGDYISSFILSSSNARGLISDNSGNLFVIANNVVFVFNLSGVEQYSFGSFDNAQGIGIDDDHAYITDKIEISGNNYIRINKYTKAGVPVLQWTTGYEFNLSKPLYQGITSFGEKLLLSASRDNKIAVYDKLGNFENEIDLQASYADYNQVCGLAIQTDNDIVATDLEGYTVHIYDDNFDLNTTFGEFGGMGPGFMNSPLGVDYDNVNDWIYVTDFRDCRIQKFNSNGIYISGFGTRGFEDGQFYSIYDIEVDNLSNLIVTDNGIRKVSKFNKDGQFISSITDDTKFQSIVSVACDDFNNIYITDRDRDKVIIYSSAGLFIKEWGISGSNDGELDEPKGICVDDIGNVYITDKGFDNDYVRLQKFSNDGIHINSINLSTSQWEGSPRLSPIDLDYDGNIIVGDDGDNKIKLVDPSFNLIYTIERYNSWEVRGQCTDQDGNIYVSDRYNQKVYKFNLTDNDLIMNLKVNLEGAYHNGEMTTHLSANSLLPASQPFNDSPWNYKGNQEVNEFPDNTVDWVLVELRDSDDNTQVVGRTAGLLLNDGNIVDIEGNQLSLNLEIKSYYVVIYHRNHLPVMSTNPISIPE